MGNARIEDKALAALKTGALLIKIIVGTRNGGPDPLAPFSGSALDFVTKYILVKIAATHPE